ncbi:protein crumbs homolog 3 [Amia ocellicauda]|uniref:protein crumbs homolog 3 n=1 Tax=Amia ocellicauda TaxID=2972642 RepID=UPI0034641D5F
MSIIKMKSQKLAALCIILILQSLRTAGMDTNSTTTPETVNIAAIVAPSVIGGLAVILAVFLIVFCVIRGKRQTEGTYRPSSEEQTGSRVETNDALKLPKEERLI